MATFSAIWRFSSTFQFAFLSLVLCHPSGQTNKEGNRGGVFYIYLIQRLFQQEAAWYDAPVSWPRGSSEYLGVVTGAHLLLHIPHDVLKHLLGVLISDAVVLGGETWSTKHVHHPALENLPWDPEWLERCLLLVVLIFFRKSKIHHRLEQRLCTLKWVHFFECTEHLSICNDDCFRNNESAHKVQSSIYHKADLLKGTCKNNLSEREQLFFVSVEKAEISSDLSLCALVWMQPFELPCTFCTASTFSFLPCLKVNHLPWVCKITPEKPPMFPHSVWWSPEMYLPEGHVPFISHTYTTHTHRHTLNISAFHWTHQESRDGWLHPISNPHWDFHFSTSKTELYNPPNVVEPQGWMMQKMITSHNSGQRRWDKSKLLGTPAMWNTSRSRVPLIVLLLVSFWSKIPNVSTRVLCLCTSTWYITFCLVHFCLILVNIHIFFVWKTTRKIQEKMKTKIKHFILQNNLHAVQRCVVGEILNSVFMDIFQDITSSSGTTGI